MTNRNAVLAQLNRLQTSLAYLSASIATGDEARLRDLAGMIRQQRVEFLEQYGP